MVLIQNAHVARVILSLTIMIASNYVDEDAEGEYRADMDSEWGRRYDVNALPNCVGVVM